MLYEVITVLQLVANQRHLLGPIPLRFLALSAIVPGYGKVSGVEEVAKFKDFLRDFLSAVLLLMEEGKPLDQIKKEFRLPKYVV